MKSITIIFTIVFSSLIYLTIWTYHQLDLPNVSELILRLSLENKIESLDPAKAFSDDSLLVSSQVLEPLYQYHYLKRPYEIQPLLAEGLPQISKDGTVIKIKIKRNVYYHPHVAFGQKRRELKADDFVIQFKRLALKSLLSPGKGLFSELIVGFDSYGLEVNDDWRKILNFPIEGFQAQDDHTLIIRMKKNEPNIIYHLALNFLVPVPWEIVEYYKNNLDSVLIGTGPYIFKSFSKGVIDMEKNREYRNEFYPTSGDRFANLENLLLSSKEKIPFIDKIRFFISDNETERWEKFFKNEVDVLTVPKSYLPFLYNKKGELMENLRKDDIVLKHFPTLANRWFAFNMRDPLLGKNKYLRQAIAHAIDYSKYIEVLSKNTNLRANSLLVPGIPGYLPAKEFRFKYDLELAKKYLKMANLDANNIPVITYSTRGNQSANILEAEFVKGQLEALGLKVKIQVLSF
jgi:ABC-type transport system substrate-binding protein